MSLYRQAVIGVIALGVWSCQTPQPADNFAVEGVAEGLADGDTLYLSAVSDKLLPLDMAVVQNGHFRITGQTDVPQVCMVYSTRHANIQTPLFIEPGNIQLYVSSEGTSRVSGTQNNEELQALTDTLELLDTNMSELISNLYEEGATRYSHDIASRQARDAAERLNDYLMRAVQHNIDNELGYYLLLHDDNVLQHEQRLSLIQRLPADMRARADMAELEQSLAVVGEDRQMPETLADHTLTTPDERVIALMSEIGKNRVTLLQFWAGWSAQYLRELPEIKRLQKRFAGEGVGLIGISIDNDAKAWRNAINTHELDWLQLSDLKGWDGDMVTTYQLDALPYYILADHTGKIIATGASIEEIISALKDNM